MFSLDDFQWLDSTQSQTLWKEISRDTFTSSHLVLKRLRSQLSQEKTAVLMAQYELLAHSAKKVPDPINWFWTRQLLEQATDSETARHTADDFPAGCLVHDICCGAGADAIAMAKFNIAVRALDRCPIATLLTSRNAKAQNVAMQTETVDAENAIVEKNSFVHIDPDRRADGARSTSLERISPSWNVIRRLLDQCEGMSLKLSPGMRIRWDELPKHIDRPPDAIRFLSKEGSVRQQRWYWGIERWPSKSITATMLLNEPAVRRANIFLSSQESCDAFGRSVQLCENRQWFHETFLQSSMLRSHEDVVVNDVEQFIADYDPSIRAAEVGPSFATRYKCQILGTESGYFTANTPIAHPMMRWFRVLDVLPLDLKKLKAYSKHCDVKNWELKSRGIDVDLNAIRKQLASSHSGQSARSILFTAISKQHRAIVCEEMDSLQS